MWCRVKPKTSYAIKLRKLFVKVTKIWTKEDRDTFLKIVTGWEDKYGKLITNKPDIPSTTNGIEGYFSRLKRNYRNHRGLAKTKRRDYFKWYFFLKPK